MRKTGAEPGTPGSAPIDAARAFFEDALKLCILGGEQLHEGDDYFVSLLMPEQVKQVAEALRPIDKEWMRARYFKNDPEGYWLPDGLSEQDFEYTWDWFDGVQGFYRKAAEEGQLDDFYGGPIGIAVSADIARHRRDRRSHGGEILVQLPEAAWVAPNILGTFRLRPRSPLLHRAPLKVTRGQRIAEIARNRLKDICAAATGLRGQAYPQSHALPRARRKSWKNATAHG
jgi:hypothetical protein